MTEATTEATTEIPPFEAPTTLVQYGLYTHDGMVRFATDEHTLVDLNGNADTTYTAIASAVVYALPGSPDWVDRMVRLRALQSSTVLNLTRRVNNLSEQTQRQEAHLTALGEALRDEAIRREWCSEYDAFAEEWDLPKRFMDYDITVTVTVRAADEGSALERVRDNFSLNEYSDDVVSGPEYDASEA